MIFTSLVFLSVTVTMTLCSEVVVSLTTKVVWTVVGSVLITVETTWLSLWIVYDFVS
jgi:hypothetical protein